MKKIIVTGNIGKNPEKKVFENGNEVVNFTIAVSVGTKQNPKTDWIDVSCSGKLGEIAMNYITKGTKVLIDGFPTVSAYVGKDNKPVATLRINANIIELLSYKEDNTTNEVKNHSVALHNPSFDDDVPF